MADFSKLADIPKDIIQKVCVSGHIDECRFFCASWEYEGDVLELHDVILETSDRVQGVTLTERWSFHPFMAFSHQHKWIVRAIGPEELPL